MDDADENYDGQQEERKESFSESSSGRYHKKDPFLIELKISKRGNASKEVKDPAVRSCDWCGKEFMKGQAYGGHVRRHAKESKLKDGDGGTSSSKSKRNIYNPELGSAEREEDTGKHMQVHSERSWRAVQPSKMSEGDEEVERSDELFPEVDLLKGLDNWSKTDKRGRIRSVDVDREAARDLTKLRAAPHGLILEVKCPIKIESSARPVICKKKNANRFQFKCTTCRKTFPTFQALLCHRSVHKNDPGSLDQPWEITPYPDQEIIAGNSVQPRDQDLVAASGNAVDETIVNRLSRVLSFDINETPSMDADEEAAIDSRRNT